MPLDFHDRIHAAMDEINSKTGVSEFLAALEAVEVAGTGLLNAIGPAADLYCRGRETDARGLP